MEPRGVEISHQRQRTPCCLDCSPDLCKHPQGCTCSHQDGQHFSNSLYKSHGRYTLSRAVPDGDKDVELVLGSRTDSLGRTSTRMPECYSRLRVQEQEGPLRVGIKSNSIPEDYGSQGRMPGRSICLPPVSQTSNILQLEARPRCISSRCPCSRLEQYKRLCLPPLLSDWQMSMQNKEGESAPDYSDNSTLALTTMVPSSDGDDHRYSPPPTSNHGTPTGSTGESPPINGSGTSPVGRLECIRSTFQGRGLSEEAVTILCASWRTSTEASYSSSWKKWSRWCEQIHINPMSTSVVNIIEFLTQEFLSGKQYRTINSYRSSISATHLPVDGMQVGKHPLITRLLKGVYHLRPPQPKYNGRWKVEDVLLYVSSLGPTDNLSIKDLTHKLALLLALANADRASDLQALDVRYVTFSPTGARFEVTNLTKTAKPDRSISSFYPYFDSNPVLCPVRTLERYLKISSEWRSAPGSHRLFLSVVKPHLPVTSATIGRWLKDVLRKAGVAQEFTGHSTRLTSVSIAFDKGVSIVDIMKTADWSSQNTFRRFYYKPLIEQSGSFAHAVLET